MPKYIPTIHPKNTSIPHLGVRPWLVLASRFFFLTAIMLLGFHSHAQNMPTVTPKTKNNNPKIFITGSFTQNQLNDVYYTCTEIANQPGSFFNLGNGPYSYCVLADSTRGHGPFYNSLHLGIAGQFFQGEKSLLLFGIDFYGERYFKDASDVGFGYFHISPYFTFGNSYFSASIGMRMGQIFFPDQFGQNSRRTIPRLSFMVGHEEKMFFGKLGFFDDYAPNMLMNNYFNLTGSVRIQNNEKHLWRLGFTRGRGDNSNSNFYGIFMTFISKASEQMFMPTFGFTRHTKFTDIMLPQFALHYRRRIF
jgi:hypothetical protein